MLGIPRPLATRLMRGQAHRRRVVRGGAFNNNDRNVRCAYRNRNNPHNRNNNIGFRVVFSTLFSPELPGGWVTPAAAAVAWAFPDEE